MPKLARVSGRRLARALEKAGFELERADGDHAFMYDRDTRRSATVPLTRRTLPVGIIANVLRQAGLTAQDLSRLLRA